IMVIAQTPLGGSSVALAQEAPPQITGAHYRIFRPDGRAATLDEVVAAMAESNVVFIGESHDDPVAHSLEAELLRRAYERFGRAGSDARGREVALSLEMFERDVQLILDEYFAGLITEQHFLSSSRAWNNYRTDYRPLVEFAREHRLAVIAANAPRRYVNRVARLGRASLDALAAEARRHLAPLPYGEPSPAYAAKFTRLMGSALTPAGQPHAPTQTTQAAAQTQTPAQAPASSPSTRPAPAASAPRSAPLLEAQALWDATMAYALAEHLRRRPQALVLHVNGRFHSEERLGAPEHLTRYVAGVRFMVISILPGEGFPAFAAERLGRLGDFVILTDPSPSRSR
ncbi:MAG: ChaN family lipoprotein, partial [Acidobacteria bacterium]|nr:ChaN family lipoprotein [Acidobacteriota bacterium]